MIFNFSYLNCNIFKGQFARHYKIHSGVKNYICPLEGCNSSFTRKDNMKYHYKCHFRSSLDENKNIKDETRDIN